MVSRRDDTNPQTPLAKLLADVLEPKLEAVKQELAQGIETAKQDLVAELVNALGPWRASIEERVSELEEAVANIRSQLARMPTLPPPAAE